MKSFSYQGYEGLLIGNEELVKKIIDRSDEGLLQAADMLELFPAYPEKHTTSKTLQVLTDVGFMVTL